MLGPALVAATLVVCCQGEMSPELQLMSSKPTKCVYERAFGMYGVHCGGLKLTSVPSNLKSGIEILDASDNKIRVLSDESFTSYTSVKYLYLEENSIYIIEEQALTPLTYMETLDLSKNAITSLPNSLLNLPSLRKLQLSGNALIYWDIQLKSLQKPIKAPLEFLDLSDCKLEVLPDLGLLPELKIYNVSDNPLTRILPDSFARTCKLMKVDLSRSLESIQLCYLKPVVNWFSLYNVNFLLEDYSRLNSNEFHQCPEHALDERLNATYGECRSMVVSAPMYRTSRQTWATITGGLAGFLVAFILLLYLMHRRNVAQTKRAAKPAAAAAAADGAPDAKPTERLLNTVT